MVPSRQPRPEPTAPLTRAERVAVAGFFLLLLAFGAITEMRSAFLQNRRTDLAVFLRAAWAVRTGDNLYRVTDEHGWHYHYPPLFAILLTPLAEPPPEEAATAQFVVPFAVSVALWYVLSIVLLLAAADRIAGCLGPMLSPDGTGPPRFSRLWWWLRLAPILVVAAPIGSSLGRSQSNVLVLAAIAFALAGFLEERRFRAGLWLAFAASIKIFPAVLLLWPLLRRDGRALLGASVGFAMFLAVIPAIAMGPTRALDAYREFVGLRVGAYLAGGLEPEIVAEVLQESHGSVFSFKALLYRAVHPNRAERPREIPPVYGLLHVLLSVAALAATAWIARPWRGPPGPLRTALGFGALLPLSVMALPAAEDHHFAVIMPLVAALLVVARKRTGPGRIDVPFALLFLGYMALTLAAHLPGVRETIDIGIEGYAALALWAAALWALPRAEHLEAQPASPGARGIPGGARER